MKYLVYYTVEVRLGGSVEVEASSAEEAKKLANEEMLRDGWEPEHSVLDYRAGLVEEVESTYEL
jgi:hypothetical protein